MTKSQSNRQTSGASHAATTLGHPPQSAVRPNASQVLSRLRDTLFAAADANLSKSFVISASHASNLPPELHALLASLPDFKAPFHPFSQPGGATIALWTTLCDPEMLKVFGKAALDAASRARDCVSSAEGVLREQAEGGVSRKRSDLWAAAMAFARTDSWGVWKDWKWWIAGVADFGWEDSWKLDFGGSLTCCLGQLLRSLNIRSRTKLHFSYSLLSLTSIWRTRWGWTGLPRTFPSTALPWPTMPAGSAKSLR